MGLLGLCEVGCRIHTCKCIVCVHINQIMTWVKGDGIYIYIIYSDCQPYLPMFLIHAVFSADGFALRPCKYSNYAGVSSSATISLNNA